MQAQYKLPTERKWPHIYLVRKRAVASSYFFITLVVVVRGEVVCSLVGAGVEGGGRVDVEGTVQCVLVNALERGRCRVVW